MSRTVAEVVVAFIAAGLTFKVALRVFPLIIRELADYFNSSIEDAYNTYNGRDDEYYER